MPKEYKTQLELALELSLESIGYPLSKRQYFFDIAMKDFLTRRNFEREIKAKFGEQFYHRLVNVGHSKQITGEDRVLLSFLEDGIFLTDFPLPIISRTSDVSQTGLRINYSVYAQDEDEKKFPSLTQEEYLEFADSLLRQNSHSGESIFLLTMDQSEATFTTKLALCIKDRIIIDDYASMKLMRKFEDLHGRTQIGELVARICQVMKNY
ncbi:hypothetical protein J4471_02355 [Candidatus Woesearchaeota archaeon]|nr:hypothetical protein [Candidatus Woesearchaeota archaeon]